MNRKQRIRIIFWTWLIVNLNWQLTIWADRYLRAHVDGYEEIVRSQRWSPLSRIIGYD